MRRISIIGLVAVCAMAFAAVVASGASAATAVEAGNTAYTCRTEGTNAGVNKFADADCSEVNNTTGTFKHIEFKPNTKTELKLVNLNTPQLKVKIATVNTTLSATGVECVGCTAENQTDPTSGKMDATGSGGKVKFTGVTTNVTNCGVAGGAVETKALKVTTLSSTKATLEPATAGSTIMAEFEFVNSGGTCPLVPNNPIKVEGHVDGALTGAIVTFNSVAGMLNVGSQTAFLTGKATVSGRMESPEPFTPLSLTPA